MARAAGIRDQAHRGVLVAGRAVQVCVCANDREPGIDMQKSRIRPEGWLVAGVALTSITALVIVVRDMAIYAGVVVMIFEVLALMTVGALQPVMLTDEREVGCIVIKANAAPGRS